ncbi:MAG: transglutaminase domain-containing protein [Candidatus Lokiarchaeota archaeon]|nr:transglutaminase domain-containing protein [Candidatus Lokiarchaeota archaeon]
MRSLKFAFILTVLLFPLVVLPSSMIILSPNQLKSTAITIQSETGVSNYEIPQSVTYSVEINFSLTHTSGANGDYWFKFSRLNDRQPNSSLTQYSGPYQESELQYSNINGSDTTPFIYRDIFNNTFDIFNASNLLPSETITVNQKYRVKLNEVNFYNINTSEIGVYDTSDEIFALYCNNSEQYYERDDFNINATSYSIVNPSDNPVVKAQKISDWVVNHIDYDDGLPAQEMGAKWAYDNQLGDCSEYSSLMVTLLRCQGIPARKVAGFVISNDPSTKPYIGQEWNFYTRSGGESNILGHAWVEYYVVGIGWIACDPTWDGQVNYFNHIDYLRFNLNIGAWFSVPQLSDASEFPHPCLVYIMTSVFDYDYNFKVSVVDINLNQFATEIIIFIIIGVILAALVIGITIIIMRRKKKRFKETNALNY